MLMWWGADNQNNLLILASLDLIQGMLLLHPPSRKLFAREIHMNVMLDLLDAGNSCNVQSATLLTLVCALIEHPQNTRVRAPPTSKDRRQMRY